MKYSAVALAAFGLLASAAPTDLKPKGFEKMRAASNSLSKRQAYTDTSNQLSLCRPVTVIFARGTTEPGNVGLLAGPPFFDALDTVLGADNVGVQGVDYGATIPGYLEGGDPAGSATLASLVEQAVADCPDSSIVVSGYSQGAQLVHNGLAEVPAATAEKVSAVVVFGDPDDGKPIPNISESIVDTYCFSTDLICEDLPIVDGAHLAYSVDALSAAEFVATKVSV